MLVFSFNQSKPKAFVPLAWAGAVLAGMAAETLITMGVKAGSKAVLKKKADDYAAIALRDGKFDFMGTNPYRNKDGSITLSPTASDRVKMAGIIGGSLVGLGVESILDGNGEFVYDAESLSCFPNVASTLKPVTIKYDYTTTDQFRALKWAELTSLAHGNFMPFYKELSTGQYEYGILNLITNEIMPGSSKKDENDLIFRISGVNGTEDTYLNAGFGKYEAGVWDNEYLKSFYVADLVSQNHITSTKNANSLGKEIYDCNGLHYPNTVEDIPQLDLSKNYTFDNIDGIGNKTMTIYNVYPPGQQEGSVTWEDIEKLYENRPEEFQAVMDSNIDTYLERGDINNYYITIEEINNDYTKLGNPEIIPEIETPEEPDDNLPVPNPDGGELVPVDPIDRSLLQIAKESYQYLADTVKSSVDGLTAVTAGATGVITFLGTTMGWLPNEWIVMFSAAFGLGLFAFFFRR